MRIAFTSPRTTTAIHTLLSSPISTSPMTCALSSMNAVGWTRGRTPRYGRSTDGLYRAGWAGGAGWAGNAATAGTFFVPAYPACPALPASLTGHNRSVPFRARPAAEGEQVIADRAHLCVGVAAHFGVWRL